MGGGDILREARALVRAEGRAVAAVAEQLGETFVQAVGLVAGCTGRVIVTGSGTWARWPTAWRTSWPRAGCRHFSFLPATPSTGNRR